MGNGIKDSDVTEKDRLRVVDEMANENGKSEKIIMKQ